MKGIGNYRSCPEMQFSSPLVIWLATFVFICISHLLHSSCCAERISKEYCVTIRWHLLMIYLLFHIESLRLSIARFLFLESYFAISYGYTKSASFLILFHLCRFRAFAILVLPYIIL